MRESTQFAGDPSGRAPGRSVGPAAGQPQQPSSDASRRRREETAAIRTDIGFDIKASNARKSRYLYEITRAMKGVGEIEFLIAEHREASRGCAKNWPATRRQSSRISTPSARSPD